MNREKTLAHIGLALVSYVPALLALAIAAFATATDGAVAFGAAFLGFLMVIMVGFGGFFVIPAAAIALGGLVSHKFVMLNALSLIFSGLWVLVYWFVSNFR